MNACPDKIRTGSSDENHRKNRVGAVGKAWQGERVNVFSANIELAPAGILPGLERVPCRPHQNTTLQTCSLGRSEVMAFDLLPGRTFILELNEGQLWVTLEGDPADYVLQAGETLRFSKPGKLVIEALTGSKFACGNE